MYKPGLFGLLLMWITATSQCVFADKYIFAWPFIEPQEMEVRGGTTKGPAVTLDSQVSRDFLSIQEKNISDFERDRRAILAMAGAYRVSFDFLEILGFSAGFKPSQPYRSWGTEYVYVIADEKTNISLQHVLVMSIINDKGETLGPFVTKHWRQDWQYEASSAHRYAGFNIWDRTKAKRKERKGKWLQTVWQVDDSPRYASWGKWLHKAEYSTWESGETWRPLPRREYSVREDYDVLIGKNRHTILADGWLHEEHNVKASLVEPNKVGQRLAREYGVARYQRIKGYDFTPGDKYMNASAEYWALVRDYWQMLMAENKRIILKAPSDKAGLFMSLFSRAQTIVDGDAFDPDKDKAYVEKQIDDFLTDSPVLGGEY